jgi:hypothetical protein
MSILRFVIVGVAILISTQWIRADDKPTTQPAKSEPIDFRKLKELMPAELGGVNRSNNEGEKVSIGDFVLSKATANYRKAESGEKDPQITVEIMDYGSAQPMAAGLTAWQTIQVDKESDSGYERTTKVKDQPAYETYQNEGKSGNVQIFVASRFIITLQTTNLSGEDVKRIAESLPIEKLAEMK